MAGRTLTSRLIMEVVDRVTGPARGIAKTVRGIDGAIERNSAALDRARGRLFDAAAGYYLLKNALTAPVDRALDLETALNGIATKANLSAETMDRLLIATRAARKESNQSTADLLKGVDYLVGMGLAAEDASTAIETIGKATTATGADITEMSQASYAAMANLKVPADQVGKALDSMAAAGKRGGFELKDMAQYFPAVGAAYQALGQKGTSAVSDLAAAMQVMRMDTGDASTAATNLQNVIQKTFAPGTVKKFAAKGVDIFDAMEKAAKRGLTPLEAIAEITNQTLDGDLSKIGFLFEDAQAQAGVRSMIQHLEEFRDIRAEAMGADGVNDRDFAKAMKLGAQRIKKFKNAMEDLAAVIGTSLLPVIERLTAILTPMIDRFAAWADANPALVGKIIAVTAAVVGLRIAVTALTYVGLLGKGGLLSAISLVGGPLVRMAGYFRAAAASSIALQVALGAMSGQSLTTLGKISVGLRGMVMAIPGVTMFTEAIAGLAAAVAAISAPVWATVAAVAAAIAAAGYMIWKYWDRISAIMSGVGRAIGEILAPALEKIRPVLEWFAPLGELIAAGWQRAKDVLSSVGEWFSGFFTRETLSGDEKAAYEKAGYDLVMAFWDGMKKVMSNVVSWVTSQIDTYILAPFTNALNKLSAWSGMTGGAAAGAPNRAEAFRGQRAKGGPISRGGRYLVGENGPEVITAGRNGYVHPNGRAPGGQVTVNMGGMTVYAAQGQSAAEIADEVWRKFEAKTRSAFRGLNADTGVDVY